MFIFKNLLVRSRRLEALRRDLVAQQHVVQIAGDREVVCGEGRDRLVHAVVRHRVPHEVHVEAERLRERRRHGARHQVHHQLVVQRGFEHCALALPARREHVARVGDAQLVARCDARVALAQRVEAEVEDHTAAGRGFPADFNAFLALFSFLAIIRFFAFGFFVLDLFGNKNDIYNRFMIKRGNSY